MYYRSSNTRHAIYGFDSLCAAARATGHRGDATLHAALGGESGIAGIVERYIGIVAADGRINHHFSGINIVRLRLMLVRHFSWLAGGPQRNVLFVPASSERREDRADLPALTVLADGLDDALQQCAVPNSARRRFLALFNPALQMAA